MLSGDNSSSDPLAYSGRDPGLGVHCKEPYSKSSCYVHLVEKKKDSKHTAFYEYVKRKCSYADGSHWANLNQTLVEWSLDGPLPKLYPVFQTSNQDGREAKNRKKGDEILIVHCCFSISQTQF
jgi:hypothetical protein